MRDKKRYIIHYENLKQALENGLILEKVHRVIQFNQCAFLRPYIMKNTTLRTAAKSDFEKNLYKLLNNSLFGKTMENIRKRLDFQMTSDSKRQKKLASKINFKKYTVFDKESNLLGIHFHKKSVFLNKPIQVGLVF